MLCWCSEGGGERMEPYTHREGVYADGILTPPLPPSPLPSVLLHLNKRKRHFNRPISISILIKIIVNGVTKSRGDH